MTKTKSKSKSSGIPLKSMFDSSDFQCRHDLLAREISSMEDRYRQLVIENEKNGRTEREDQIAESMRNGMTYEAAYHDAQIKSIEPLQQPLQALLEQRKLLDAIKGELLLQAKSGNNIGRTQREKAQKKRSITNDEGATLDGVIARLANAHPDEKPSEIWPHLKTAILEWSGSDCAEIRPNEKKRDSWTYQFTKRNGSPDAICYQTFRRKPAFKKRKTGN